MYTLTIQNSTDEGFIEAKPVLDGFYSQKVQQIPVAPEDPRLGPDKSMINIVVFSDFLCPACKRFSKELQKINEEGQGKYSIVFKNFPLSTNCNHAILKDLHPQSCEAAYAGVAANMQGKFWEFHDALFNASGRGYDDFSRTIAQRAGFDMQRFDSARHTAAVKDKITRDVLLAQQLNIDATPTVFLNGRLVTDMRPGILGILVRQELKRTNLVDSLF
jgi:protein-disulfide isomerase